MTLCRFFTVKTGDNAGTYVAITDDVSGAEQVEVMARNFCCGSIQKYNFGFYNRHRANDSTIWRVEQYGTRASQTWVEKIKGALIEQGWEVAS